MFVREPVFCFLIALTVAAQVSSYPFVDVSLSVGLHRPFGRRIKYGGAALADLNDDGHVDMLLGHHDQHSVQVYFNNGNGTFRRSSFHMWRDTHALNPVRLSVYDKTLHFTLSRGGAYGKKLSHPDLFSVSTTGDPITEVTDHSDNEGLVSALGRGRTVVFMSMHFNRANQSRSPSMLVVCAQDVENGLPHRFAFEISTDPSAGSHKFQKRPLNEEFSKDLAQYLSVTDIDNDGQMELLTLSDLSLWKLTADFTLSDISESVLPKPHKKGFFACSSIAELDFDNDGHWDLVITRSATNDLRWRRNVTPRLDVLLRNENGSHYTDVSAKSGIWIGQGGVKLQSSIGRNSATMSRGVTVGDFDNDGWVDIFIVRYDSNPAMILLRNQGDGTFKSVAHGLQRDQGVVGDMPTAVDYDGDGRVDLVLSEGDWFNRSRGGYYRVIRNLVNNGNSFLLVRIGNAPTKAATALHAVVTVTTFDGMTMMRRVGSPSTSVSVSFVQTLHFGLGKRGFVKHVIVQWTDGSTARKSQVKANTTLKIGV